MKQTANFISLLSASLILFPFMTGCGGKSAESGSETQETSVNVTVQTTPVRKGLIRQIIQANGVLNALPNQDVKISALVPGRVNELLAMEGDAVENGQVIATLDSSTLEDQVKEAQAALESARANEVRTEKLFERGIAAGREKEDAHHELVAAQSAYDTVQTQLSRAHVRSPISGTVVKRFVNVGEQVDGTSNEPIMEVANDNPIELTASLQTSFLSLVKVGLEAEVRTDAFSNVVFQGKIVAILPIVDPATNAVAVRIRIANGSHQLRSGMFASAGIITSVRNDAISVPTSSLVMTNEEPKVFVVRPDSTVQERRVKTGWRDGENMEILEGVKPGEMVVTIGSYGLADRMKVTVMNGNEHAGAK